MTDILITINVHEGCYFFVFYIGLDQFTSCA